MLSIPKTECGLRASQRAHAPREVRFRLSKWLFSAVWCPCWQNDAHVACFKECIEVLGEVECRDPNDVTGRSPLTILTVVKGFNLI